MNVILDLTDANKSSVSTGIKEHVAIPWVYRVLGKRAAKNGDIPRNNDLAKRWKAASHHFYVLELDEQFADLKDRLVIEWGRGTQAWCQRLSRSKAILEISEPGRALAPFQTTWTSALPIHN